MSSILAAGTAAPDFTLRVTPDQNLTLSNLRGRPVILAFYPADWSPVCGDQVTLYNEVLPEFHKHKAELLGVSVDGVWCHAAFARDRRLHFPLLADFEPKGEVARNRAYRANEGVCERALFVLSTILLITEQLGLTETALRNALETGQYRNKVRSDFMGGIRSGVNGTPAFFINGVRHDGSYDYASLVAGIQMRLAADTSA
jgi:peroxiredoxin